MLGTSRTGAAAARIALASLLSRRDGWLEARVEGRSMGATLPEGSLIRVRPGRDRDVAPGDVVAIAVNEKIVVHRVLRVARAKPPLRGRGAAGAAVPRGAGSDARSSPGASATAGAGAPSGTGGQELLVTESGPLLLTRGDGEILPDPPVPAAWVIGAVIEARIGEGTWKPVGVAPRSSLLRSIPASAAAGMIGALLEVSPALADRTSRALLFGAHLARFVLTGGREGRLAWPGRT